MKRLFAAAGIVVALGAGAFALSTVLPANAQSDPGTASSAPDGHKRGDRMKAVLDGLVADGTITQAQQDAIIAAFKATEPKGGSEGIDGRHPHILKKAVDTAALALGMSADDLKAELKAGKTVADVASGKGIALDTVTHALTEAATTAINQAVTDGKLTQDQAVALTARIPDAIAAFENGHLPKGGRHHK